MQANLGAAASHRLTSLVDGVLLEVRRVCAAAVVRDVNPSLLLLHRDAQAAGGLQGPEDDRDCYGGPGEDGDDPDDVGQGAGHSYRRKRGWRPTEHRLPPSTRALP